MASLQCGGETVLSPAGRRDRDETAVELHELLAVDATGAGAIGARQDGVARLRPLARLFSGNPYNEVAPPGLDAPKLILERV